LGVLYEYGEGVPIDYETAAFYLEQSADQGHASAQLNLGLLYRKGFRGIPDYHRAIYWLQMAADAGHPKAFGAIGELYLNGFGVDKSLEKAIHYIEQSAARAMQRLSTTLASCLLSITTIIRFIRAHSIGYETRLPKV
jgi:TPR repeat protein